MFFQDFNYIIKGVNSPNSKGCQICLGNGFLFLLSNEFNCIIMKQVVIWGVVCASAYCLTSLTTANCPSEFNPSSYNTSLSYTNQDLAISIYSRMFSSETQVKIQRALDSGDLSALEAEVLSLQFQLPFILAGVFFFLLFLTSICCCTFDRRCPPCESWRRNYIKQPYSKIELRLPMLAAILFSVALLITTVVAFSTFANLKTDLKMVSCGLYYTLDTALNGDQTNKWGGFSSIQSQVSNTSLLLSSTANTITNTLSNNEWIVTGMQKLEDMNLALWTNNNQSTVYTPNPTTTQLAINLGNPLPTVTPLFIQQYLGPNGTANTMITDIDQGLQVTKKLSNQAYTTYKSAMNLKNSALNITANTNANLKGITNAAKYLNNIQASVNYFQTSFIGVAVDMGLYGMQAIFGIVLLASIISLLGIISTHIFDVLACRRFVHTGWGVFGLIYFGVLFVLYMQLSVGGLSYNFCQYFASIIKSQNGFISFTDSTSASNFNKFFDYLDVCLFDDGNILKKFQLAKEMESVSEVFLNVQAYLNMQTSGNTQYVEITTASTKILSWMNQITNYGSGITIDSTTSDTSENNPTVALANMNKITNQNTPAVDTLCANDYWVFDVANCTYGPTQSIYSPSPDTTNGLYFPPTGTLCIPLNTRISQSAPSIWTSSDIAQRYLSVRSCKVNSNLAYEKLNEYAISVTNYRDSRINLYKSLNDQLTSLLSATNEYNSNMSAFTGNVNTFSSSASALNNIVTNQLNGLTISSNCTIIADTLRFFYNMYCVNFINRSVKIVICCILVLVLMTGSVLVGSVFGVRYERVEKERKFKGLDNDSQIFKQGQMESSESSYSSNEEQH